VPRLPVVIVTPAEALASVARPPAARGRRTLAELAQAFLRWLEAHHRPQTTIESYGDGLGAFLTYATGVGMEYADQVTVLALDGYYVWLRSRGKSASTMAHRRSVLIAFWKWLEHEGFAERNVPAKTYPIKTPKRLPVYLEPHQIDTFLGKLAALTDLGGQRDHAVVATFFYAGFRVSELATLRLADVDMIGARIRVNQGKGGRDRIVTVPPRLRPILQRYIDDVRPALVGRGMGCVRRDGRRWRVSYVKDGEKHERGAATREEGQAIVEREASQPVDGGWFFVNASRRSGHRLNSRGQSLIARSWYQVIHRRARQLLGVKLSPHKLRHTCATYLLYHGAQLETIQRLLGHADVRTTMIYLHTPQKRQEEEIAKIFG
jgi:integrase/recombinase XerD